MKFEIYHKFIIICGVVGGVEGGFPGVKSGLNISPDLKYMADRYFPLCTAEEFRSATGQLFNDKLEAMCT